MSAKSAVPHAAEAGQRLVFVVDDHQLLGEITEGLLQAAGYDTRLFSDPLLARDALLRADPAPDALVTDYDLGPMKGLDLIAVARSVSPTMKCVLVSGTADPELLLCQPVKADQFIAKPFNGTQLVGTVDRLLET